YLKNIQNVLDRASNNWGDKTAIIYDETHEQYSFHDVKIMSEKYAAILSKLGINKNDKVAIMLPNIPSFTFSWLATGIIGAVTVPLNYRYQKFDASYVIEHSESKLIITSYDRVPMLHNIRESNNLSFMIITVDEKDDQADGFLPELIEETENIFVPNYSVFNEDIMNIQYTSGTTGKPKGCMLSQYYWMNIAEKIANPSLIGINESDIT